jgi:hypothetical protein
LAHTGYAEQSAITHPGRMAPWLEDLPRTLTELQRVTRGLVLHYRADDPAGHGIPDERLSEIDSRYAEAMLERLFELDDRSLKNERVPQARLLGCCRDFTVLFLTMTGGSASRLAPGSDSPPASCRASESTTRWQRSGTRTPVAGV